MGCIAVFIATRTVRYWTEEYAVSQVFKLLRAVPLGGEYYIGFYDAALTPSNPDKTVEQGQVIAVTPKRYVNLLEMKVRLFPNGPPFYFFCETKTDWGFSYLLLGAGILLWILGFFLFRKKEE